MMMVKLKFKTKPKTLITKMALKSSTKAKKTSRMMKIIKTKLKIKIALLTKIVRMLMMMDLRKLQMKPNT